MTNLEQMTDKVKSRLALYDNAELNDDFEELRKHPLFEELGACKFYLNMQGFAGRTAN